MENRLQDLGRSVKAGLEALRRIGPAGAYWDSDELMDVLRYVRRKVWLEIIREAKSTCRCSGEDAGVHFRQLVDPALTGGRPRIKYELTAYACWLIAGNCAPRRPGVAAAVDYFGALCSAAEEPVRRADHVACMNGPIDWPVAMEQDVLVEEDDLVQESEEAEEQWVFPGPARGTFSEKESRMSGSDSTLDTVCTQVEIWGFEGQELRESEWNGQRVWVAADVCRCCGLRNASEALSGLDEDEKGAIRIADTTGRLKELLVVTESGLWSLVLKSRRPEAKRFKKLLTSEVIPALRKTGTYTMRGVAPPAMDTATVLASAASLILPIVQSQIQEAKEFNARLVASLNEQVGKDLVRVESKVDSLYQEAAFTEEDFKRQLEDQRKEIEELQKAMPPKGHATVIAFAKFKGVRELAENEFRDWGGRLKSRAKKLGIILIPVPDLRFGLVNSYPLDFLESTFDELGPLRYRDRG